MTPSKSVLSKPLTLKKQAFVKAYCTPGTETFGNQTKAYAYSHPTAKYTTARNEGSEVLAEPCVRQAVQEQLASAGLSKEDCQRELAWGRDHAKAKKDYNAHEKYVMDIAKLGGYLVEKHEDVSKTPTLSEAELRIELEKRLKELQS